MLCLGAVHQSPSRIYPRRFRGTRRTCGHMDSCRRLRLPRTLRRDGGWRRQRNGRFSRCHRCHRGGLDRTRIGRRNHAYGRAGRDWRKQPGDGLIGRSRAIRATSGTNYRRWHPSVDRFHVKGVLLSAITLDLYRHHTLLNCISSDMATLVLKKFIVERSFLENLRPLLEILINSQRGQS
jgi:hypothetical protein